MNEIQVCLNCKKYRCDNCFDNKYTWVRKREIYQVHPGDLEIVEVFPSIVEAARRTGISEHRIRYALKIKGKPAGGFLWEYAIPKNEVKPSV